MVNTLLTHIKRRLKTLCRRIVAGYDDTNESWQPRAARILGKYDEYFHLTRIEHFSSAEAAEEADITWEDAYIKDRAEMLEREDINDNF